MSYVVCRDCGMAEPVFFAHATGRLLTPQEALDLARRFGWDQGGAVMTEEREHTLSKDCWCHPTVDTFGAEYEYDAQGEVTRIKGASVVHKYENSDRLFLLHPLDDA